MTEPRRLLSDPDASSFERDLLESWSSEGPSPDARTRALTLVAGAVAGAVAATATATGGATSAAGATAAPKVVAGAGLSGAAKIGVLGVMVLVSAIAGVTVLRSSRDAAPMPTPSVATEPAPAPAPTSVPALVPTIDPPSVSPADLPTAPSVALSAGSASPSTRAPGVAAGHTEPPSSVTDEIAAFDRARSALEAGEIERAIGLLDAYERRFPAGTFAQEAEVLRVKALAAKGDRAGARRSGERFLAAHPTSPHAPRIRAIVDSSRP